MLKVMGSSSDKTLWFLIIVPLVSIILLFLNIDQPLIEMHGFRQTQTALTTYWLGINGFDFAYETPVVGYPWSIPFEFPVYQVIVLFFSKLSGFELDESGRIVSIIFFIISFFPAHNISKKLDLHHTDYFFYLILMSSVPLYLFWSRTFMIETAAIFFTLLAFNFFLDLIKQDFKISSILWFVFWLVLGLLQKITTAGPVLIVMGAIFSISYFKVFGVSKIQFGYLIKVFIAALLPVIVAVSWASYSDHIKTQNDFGHSLTSEALHKWNFGTMEQRLSFDAWKKIIWDRLLLENLAGILGLILLILGPIVLRGKERIIFFVLLALFILPILIFFNLHYIHNYYQTANTFYLVAAVALVVSNLHLRFCKKYVPIGILLALIFVGTNYASYHGGYYNQASKEYEEKHNSILSISSAIRENTDKNSAIAVYGADWSSEITYYSQRKSISVPRWAKNYEQAWANPESLVGDLSLSALVFCNFSEKFTLSEINFHPMVNRHPFLYKINSCYLWLPAKDNIVIDSVEILPDRVFSKTESLSQFDSVNMDRCDGSIDVINGVSTKPARMFSVEAELVAKGWGIVDTSKQILGEHLYLIMAREGDNYLIFDTLSSKRKDVAKFFGNDAYEDSGFSAQVDLSTVASGEYRLFIAIENNNSLRICMNISQVVQVEQFK